MALLPLVAGLVACGSRKPIPEKTTEKILYETFITYGIVSHSDSLSRLNNHNQLDPYSPIVERYGYTLTEFDSTLSYYCRHPERLDALLDKILARIELERSLLVDTAAELRVDTKRLQQLKLN